MSSYKNHLPDANQHFQSATVNTVGVLEHNSQDLPPPYEYEPPSSSNQGNTVPEDTTKATSFDFSNNKNVRHIFIRQLYSLLLLQLGMSLIFIEWFSYCSPIEKAVRHDDGTIFLVALILLFVIMISMAFCGELRRNSPVNYICLAIFTVAQSVVLAIIGCGSNKHIEAQTNTLVTLMTVGIIAAVCLTFILLTFQTKYVIDLRLGIIVVLVVILLILAVVAYTQYHYNSQNRNFWVSAVPAFVHSCYVVCDIQLMLLGKHKYALTPKEYVFAVLNLNIDLVNLVVYVLISPWRLVRKCAKRRADRRRVIN